MYYLKILLLLLTIVIVVRYYITFKRNDNKLSLNDYLKIAKSGDIILFSRYWKNNIMKNIQNTTNQVCIGIPYTHVGIVHKNFDNELMICDISSYDKYQKVTTGEGACNPISSRIRNYHGEVSVRLLRVPLNYEQETQLYTKIKKMEGIQFVNELRYHIFTNCFLRKVIPFWPESKAGGMYCSEYLGNVLRSIGILSEQINPKCVYPIHFTSGHDKQTFTNDVSYSQQYLLTF